MKVKVAVEETTLEGDNHVDVEGIEVRCMRCDHTVEVFGTSEASTRRGCVMLRDECPNSEKNFYEDDS